MCSDFKKEYLIKNHLLNPYCRQVGSIHAAGSHINMQKQENDTKVSRISERFWFCQKIICPLQECKSRKEKKIRHQLQSRINFPACVEGDTQALVMQSEIN
jgi:hypothetical protein